MRSAQDSLATQTVSVVATGKAAARALFEARDALRLKRVADVSARLSQEFDWTAISATPAALAAVHKTVRAIKDFGVSHLFYQLQHDDSFTIGAVRHLEEHWSELKQLIDAENVELSIAAVQVPAIPKPKPTASGSNTLGTLTQAVAA